MGTTRVVVCSGAHAQRNTRRPSQPFKSTHGGNPHFPRFHRDKPNLRPAPHVGWTRRRDGITKSLEGYPRTDLPTDRIACKGWPGRQCPTERPPSGPSYHQFHGGRFVLLFSRTHNG